MRTILALSLLLTSAPALADGASIVIPNRHDVPIIINGINASFAVVEGDWGLARSVHVQPTIYGGRVADPGPIVGGYFPSAGRAPGYGRLEIEPAKRPRTHNSSYFRAWGAQSELPRPPEAGASPPLMLDAQIASPADSAMPRPRRR